MWTLIIVLVVAGALVWLAVSSRSAQTVVRDKAMLQQQQESASSYEQTTNHFPRPSYDLGPVAGVESPFRVNMYQAYIE